ncbi:MULTISPECIES: RNA polymerase sigma factor [unclassified Olleya]|jgi:RNA polymerase sigma factor (sigma-70 family)|uniref:RNA polymerase sigma factor n=1 Tax=unclassified Olleya TaxID=2615019 RepID=UPI0011A02410|nr:sigma-70 family RNA polymerase sigma factor [Olleya sp. Hel_I_94]TVZ47996.1 RNA polymerase sigma factor (sigma-70 family) [Olleya sp. Hel_I_94]|tara:strand:- start:130613 stop:131146 length:534 start_codon:yes stop_codon:yes gene_type:complete
MNDKKILEFFKTGQRDKAFKQLYSLYPRIEKLVLSKGGKQSDAQDVFQEALIILNRNLEQSDFKLTASFYTYLYSVSRFVWKDMQSKFTTQELHDLKDNEVSIFQHVLEEKKYRFAENAFRELGERCQQLLQLFYLKRIPFKEIAVTMQFKSEKIAKNQKYKCLKKAKDIFHQNYQS